MYNGNLKPPNHTPHRRSSRLRGERTQITCMLCISTYFLTSWERWVPWVRCLKDGQDINHDHKYNGLSDQRHPQFAKNREVCSTHSDTQESDNDAKEAFSNRFSRETSNSNNNGRWKYKRSSVSNRIPSNVLGNGEGCFLPEYVSGTTFRSSKPFNIGSIMTSVYAKAPIRTR